MKTNNLFIKTIFILSLLIILPACNSNLKPSTENQNISDEADLLELDRKANIAYLNNELEASAAAYETLIKKVPEEPLHWFRLANTYVRMNRPQEAIELYREALVRDPKYSKAWYNLSIVQLKQTAYNLNEMLIYTDENDPLYKKAKKLLGGIQEIVQQE